MHVMYITCIVNCRNVNVLFETIISNVFIDLTSHRQRLPCFSVSFIRTRSRAPFGHLRTLKDPLRPAVACIAGP